MSRSSSLPNANRWLRLLKKHLNRLSLQRVHLVLDKGQEALHADDNRAFAHVRKGSRAIYVCADIEVLPENYLVGVLLHELVHLLTQSFGGQTGEVKVDEWIVRELPEAGFGYASLMYNDGWRDVPVENLERVSDSFLDLISLEDE